MSYLNESWPNWMSRVTLNKSCHSCIGHLTLACVMSHIWMSHVTHMNEACHTHEWVMSHVMEMWDRYCLKEAGETCDMSSDVMSRVTPDWVVSHLPESCRTCMIHVTLTRVMSHLKDIWVRYCLKKLVIHVTYEWVMSHLHESCHGWRSHERIISRTNKTCLNDE